MSNRYKVSEVLTYNPATVESMWYHDLFQYGIVGIEDLYNKNIRPKVAQMASIFILGSSRYKGYVEGYIEVGGKLYKETDTEYLLPVPQEDEVLNIEALLEEAYANN